MARKVVAGHATPVSIAEIEEPMTNRLPTDANLQVGDANVHGGNPVPVDVVAGVAAGMTKTSVTATATIGAGAFLSDEIDMSSYSGGNVYIPAAWTNADIGFHAAPTSGGTFVPLYDDNGNVVQMTVGAVTDECHAFPPEVFACRFIKFWSQLAGVDTNQVAERSLVYELKS
jgi:hypothetical protein